MEATIPLQRCKINACPVNGPVMEASENQPAVGWFTTAMWTERTKDQVLLSALDFKKN